VEDTAVTNVDLMLKAVLAEPDEDTVRLAYADALDEAGGEEDTLRAELIRLMIDINKEQPDFRLDWGMNSKVYSESADHRIRRSVELVRLMFKANFFITQPLSIKKTMPEYHSYSVWRRGFVEEYVESIKGWDEVADDICLRHPIKKVRLKPLYQWDFLRTEVRADPPNWFVRYKAEWQIGNRQRWTYHQAVPERDVQFDAEGVQGRWEQAVWTETAKVFHIWYPTVEEFKW
jgi:uncharacterized protein (TIGR02996 family)